jgi:fructose-1,6-bisphosphatase/inositol monophosphatase family enzyme
MNKNLLNHVKEMISLGREIILTNPILSEETGETNAKGDKTIAMDKKIENALVEYIKKENIPANIFSEEIGEIKFHENPKYLISFDPLDGSTNYKIGKNIYPYGLLIAIYEGTVPQLKNVVAAGAIEYSQNLSWFYSDGKTFNENGERVILKTDWVIGKSTPFFLDLYYEQGYKLYKPLAGKIFIRNIGSTIGNLSYVLSNIATGLGGVCMRPEEIGAIYSLIKGAGGITVNHQGKDIGEEKFSPNATHQILAGTKNVIDFVVNALAQ